MKLVQKHIDKTSHWVWKPCNKFRNFKVNACCEQINRRSDFEMPNNQLKNIFMSSDIIETSDFDFLCSDNRFNILCSYHCKTKICHL